MSEEPPNEAPLALYQALSPADRAAVDRQLSAVLRGKLKRLIATPSKAAEPPPPSAPKYHLGAYTPWLSRHLMRVVRGETPVTAAAGAAVNRLLCAEPQGGARA